MASRQFSVDHSIKDDLASEVPVAFIVRTKGSEINEDEIKKFVAKEVVFYKRINKVFFTDSIPKNPSADAAAAKSS
ncbi:hypothetical protein E2562_004004 [Oryza meyeriana var. granulata]|uniref:AMP-binding enzyme C-terminal domain-containing protein n=1 Tax=Oryza meyeriana var. granulata TaxID=110450 RepID=A0A6G1BJ97_9ORYZ|nr:hypothetical protein E2562_004004 [Oryza meyeriana var. granulata]